jgi:hypothetical protein
MSSSIGPKTLIPMEVPDGRQGERVTPTRRSRELIYCGRGMDDWPTIARTASTAPGAATVSAFVSARSRIAGLSPARLNG